MRSGLWQPGQRCERPHKENQANARASDTFRHDSSYSQHHGHHRGRKWPAIMQLMPLAALKRSSMER